MRIKRGYIPTNKIARLFKYNYVYYVQGTKEYDVGYAQLIVPATNSFRQNKELLYTQRYERYNHEIDPDSIEDLTIIG